MNRKILTRIVLLVATLFVAAGCPQSLDDDFKVGSVDGTGSRAGDTGGAFVDAGLGGSDTGGGGTGGVRTGGTSGTGTGGDTGAGGTPDTGGALATGGRADASGGETSVVDSGDGSTVTPCGRCRRNETCCDGECVDLNFDAKDCRECGVGCPGTTCFNASCTNQCAQGFIDCNRNVVDGCEVNAAVDPENCGNCGIACAFSQGCVGGNCVCTPGQADCDGQKANGCEQNTLSDSNNCGACGKTCGNNQACVGGTCTCTAGSADCNKVASDGCEASLTAADTCGSCSLDCGPHGACTAAGQCGCQPGFLDCEPAAGCETAATDPAHCGSCTQTCTGATPQCNGTACINACGALTACGSSCVDLKTDAQNCGACGKPVGLNQTCVGGKPVCVTGFANCDANVNDCETDTRSDKNHCGTCAGVCKAGAVCTDSACTCAPGTPNDCGTTCQQCCNDGQCSDGDSCTADTCNAGVCGSGAKCAGGGNCCAGSGCFACCGDLDCGPGKVCSGNQCVNLMCTPPQIVCNSKCVNPLSDGANCGGCGNDCGAGRTCGGGGCTPKWVATSPPPVGFIARERAAYTAMGTKVFMWGGNDATPTPLATGAVYDAVTNTWTTVNPTGAPTARVLATAVWTGSVVVVWGGGNASTSPFSSADYNTGGRYDPATNTWTAMSTTGAPPAMRAAFGVWTGSRVLIYGGYDRIGTPIGGIYLYDPVNDTWTTGTTSGAPSARTNETIGWTGSALAVYGGVNSSGTSFAEFDTYDPVANRWAGFKDGPSARYGAFGTWDGGAFVVWGGNTPAKNDGSYYDLASGKWVNIKGMGAPTPRWAPQRYVGWTTRLSPGVTLLVGGIGTQSSTFFTDGAIFNSTTNAWAPVPSWASGASHINGVGVWTGTEFVVWGGRSTSPTSTLTLAGDRLRP